MSLSRILLIVVLIDFVLGIFVYFTVFNPPGTYEVANSPLPATSTAFPSSTIATTTASSTVSSTIPTSTSTITGNPSQSVYSSDFAPPYPLTWNESGATLSLMGATLQGNQLTLALAVTIGNSTQCIPINLRILADEQGNLAAPITPQFTFPESNSCQGAPGATYTDQEIVFNADPASFPAFFTTGGTSNIFFQISTTTAGGILVTLPQKNG